MNNKHTILYKYFFIVLSISIFVAIVGLFASYKFTELVILEQVNEKSIEQLEQVRSVFNSVHFSNIPAAVQLSRDRLINELMYSSNVTKSEILQALSRLNTAKLSNPLISSIIVYNHLNHRFYSTQEGIIERDDFQDKQLIEMLDNAKEFGLYRYIPRINNNDETVFTLLLGTMPTSGKSLKGAMITNISERALRSLLSSSAAKLTGELIIYDRDGMILSHSQKELFAQKDESSVYIQQLISDTSERGTFVFYDENIKMLLTYIRYVDFGWIFVTLTPYEDILHSVYIARNRVLTVLFFMLLISLIVAFIVSRYLYQPIGIIRNFALEVDNEYSPLKQTENLSDELEYVDAVFRRLYQTTRNLDNTVNKNHIRNKQHIVRNIILSGESEDFIEIEDSFRIVVIHFDNSINIHLRLGSVKIFEVLRKICKRIDTDFSLTLPTIVIESGQLAFFQFSEQDQLTHKFASLTEYQDSLINLQFTVGLGSYVNSFDEAPLSYHQALEAVKDRFKSGPGKVIDYLNLRENAELHYRYPEDINKKLINAVRDGELEKSYKEFKKILEDIKKYCYEDFLLMSRIMVYQFQNNFRQEKFPQGAFILSSIRARVNHFESIFDFEKSIKEIIETIIKEKFNINSQKTNELSLRAKEMIDENINECNLCSKWLSSQLEISTNYLRTVFRDFQGSSISEYINGKRIIYGQVLLETTDIPVKELYSRLGFSNYNYFFTIFKKYTGVTPVQYKRKARTDKIEVNESFQN